MSTNAAFYKENPNAAHAGRMMKDEVRHRKHTIVRHASDPPYLTRTLLMKDELQCNVFTTSHSLDPLDLNGATRTSV